MIKARDEQLMHQFQQLLQDIDPDIKDHPDFEAEFAARLADFTEAWATSSENLDRCQSDLEDWILSNTRSTEEHDVYDVVDEESSRVRGC